MSRKAKHKSSPATRVPGLYKLKTVSVSRTQFGLVMKLILGIEVWLPSGQVPTLMSSRKSVFHVDHFETLNQSSKLETYLSCFEKIEQIFPQLRLSNEL